MVEELPTWESGTAAVLSVHGPHAIPVSTSVRLEETETPKDSFVSFHCGKYIHYTL